MKRKAWPKKRGGDVSTQGTEKETKSTWNQVSGEKIQTLSAFLRGGRGGAKKEKKRKVGPIQGRGWRSWGGQGAEKKNLVVSIASRKKRAGEGVKKKGKKRSSSDGKTKRLTKISSKTTIPLGVRTGSRRQKGSRGGKKKKSKKIRTEP